MFNLVSDLIGYVSNGTYQTNLDTYIMSITGAIIILLVVMFGDLVYRLIRAVIHKS